ncbi:MAG: AraC family transcriptional regulator [Myxococcales bacterium]|nr:AraC family transcriptional regulator [Myxococcales bacterium]
MRPTTKTSSKLTLSGAWLSYVLHAFEELGLDVAEIARGAEVDLTGLSDPNARIARDEVGRLWREAMRLTGDSDLGLHAGEHSVFSANNWIALLIMTSKNFFEGMQATARYQRILAHGRVVEAERVPNGCKLTIHRVTDGLEILRQEMEFVAVVLHKLAESVRGERVRCEEVAFLHPFPGDSREHERVFGCPVRFGVDQDFLILPERCAFAPSLHYNPRLRAMVEDSAAAGVAEVEGPFSLEVKVAAYTLLLEKRCTVDNVARALHTSTRTVQRRLGEEGVAFRDVVRECKLDTAVRCLEAGQSPDDAAERAGFSSRRAFDRAFKEWTGASPASFVTE